MAKAPEAEEGAAEHAQEGEGAPAKGGGGLMKWIIIGVVALVVLGGGGFAGWWFFMRSPVPAAAKVDAHGKPGEPAAGGAGMAGPILPLTPFIVNLADPGGRRYLKATIELELDKKEGEGEFKGRLPEIKDQINSALSTKTSQQVLGGAGKQVLKEELTARLNTILKTAKVKNVFFTEFVVQ